MATTATAPRGSGLYLRNTIWWVRIRTPAVLEPKENSLRRFFRFPTRTSCFSEASRAAAHVRAALDRGFALARIELGTTMVDAVQVEAMLTRLAQNALAAAEASRALAGVRDAARVAEACRRHEEDLVRWRDALARNEFSQIGAKVGLAAQEAGVPASAMASPIVMREAARTLAAVAEENISREHGIYAGDRARLTARLDASAAPQMMRAGPLSLAPAAPPSVARVCEPQEGAEAGLAPPIGTSPEGRHEGINPQETPHQAFHGSWFSGAGDERLDGQTDPAPESPAGTQDRQTKEARKPDPQASSVASPTPAKAPRPRKKALPTKAGRSGPSPRTAAKSKTPAEWLKTFRTPEMTELRALQGEELWRLPLDKAIDLERGVRSRFGGNISWLNASLRGFDGMASLATSWFAQHLGLMPCVRDIIRADLEMFVEDLSRVPGNWNKGQKIQGAMHDVIALADEADERATLRVEQQALLEGWSEDRREEALHQAIASRLAPGTQYKHQSYLKGVFQMIADRSEIGRNPMEQVIWSKSYMKKLQAERGDIRTALGPDGRARLFGSSVFLSTNADEADPLFWAPLLARYCGARAEEILQLAPGDIRRQDGVVVFDLHAGAGNSLKSPSASRRIPVHDELLRLGLVALAERRKAIGASRLFDVKRGALGTFSSWFSKRYHNYRTAEGLYQLGKDFHSLRKDFYQDLRAAQVDYPVRVHLMGHALKDVSETNYGPAHQNLRDLKRCIDRIPADTLAIRPRA